MERAFEPGAGEPGVASDAEWPAGAWGDPVHEQPPRGGLSPVTVYGPGTGQGLGGLSAPILLLPVLSTAGAVCYTEIYNKGSRYIAYLRTVVNLI